MRQKTIKYSGNLRAWHWLNAMVICGSLLTVMINSTLFDRKTNTALFIKALWRAGIQANTLQARAVSYGLEEKVWDWHVYIGYALVALLLYRLITELLLHREQRFTVVIRKTFMLYRVNNAATSAKKNVVKLVYLLFYIQLFFMAISGLTIKFHYQLGLSNDLEHSLKEMHGFVMYLILSFMVLHVAGVVNAERGDKKGIVSDMINGGSLAQQ